MFRACLLLLIVGSATLSSGQSKETIQRSIGSFVGAAGTESEPIQRIGNFVAIQSSGGRAKGVTKQVIIVVNDDRSTYTEGYEKIAFLSLKDADAALRLIAKAGEATRKLVGNSMASYEYKGQKSFKIEVWANRGAPIQVQVTVGFSGGRPVWVEGKGLKSLVACLRESKQRLAAKG